MPGSQPCATVRLLHCLDLGKAARLGGCVEAVFQGQRDKAVENVSCADWGPKGQYDGYSAGLVEEMGARDLSSRI